jgi:hypothetical protein
MIIARVLAKINLIPSISHEAFFFKEMIAIDAVTMLFTAGNGALRSHYQADSLGITSFSTVC